MKIVAYARVSTLEQHANNQLLKIRQYADIRSWEIVKEYVDHASGADINRPALNELLEACGKPRRPFSAVIVWKLDRLGRDLADLIKILDYLRTNDINFISITDSIDTSTPEGRLFFHVIGAFAEYEKDIIRTRVKLGLERAKAEGKKLGRPSNLNEDIKREVIELHKAGMGKRKIAKRFGIGVGTVINIIKEGI